MSMDVAAHGARGKKVTHRMDRAALRFAVPVGRVLFALIFLLSTMGNFSRETIAYATSQGVPFAGFLVPLSGLLSLAYGLSVALPATARGSAPGSSSPSSSPSP